MPEADLAEALTRSVEEVLETMCFAQAVPVQDTPELEDKLSICVPFHGSRSGSLQMLVSRSEAIALTANFLGTTRDQISNEQMDETACELAKTICGHLMSALDPAARLTINVPSARPPEHHGSGITRLFFRLEAGFLGLSIQFD